MKLKSIVHSLNITPCNAYENNNIDIDGGYCSDLLSDVMGNARENDLWITMQIHKNIIAVAAIKKLAGIILINDREPDKETLDKAREENIPVFTSNLPAFELAGRLYNLGLRGKNSTME